MLNKNKLQELKNKRSDLIRYLHHCGYHKKRVIEIVREISSQHKSNRITYEEYSRKLSFSLNQRTPEQWLDYYDERIRECNKQLERVAGEIENEESRARKINLLPLFVIVTMLMLFGAGLFFLQPAITGLITADNATLEENISGAIISEENLTLPESLTEIELPEEITISESLTEEQVVVDTQIEIEEDVLIQGYVEINRPVKWVKRVKLKESTDSLTIKLSDKVSDIKVSRIVDEVKEEIEEDKIRVIKDDEIKPIALTGYAVMEPEIGKDEIGLIIDEDVEEVEIEYYTEGPGIIEKEISNGRKEVMVYSDVHYENILAYTSIDDVNRDLIKLYRTTNGVRESTEIIDYVDENDNKLIDKIKWIVPSLSNETYEVIIEISKAVHLDENKEFISDIYNEVYRLDNNWSEEIENNEYVRVTFKKNLTNENDITIYPRTISGSPRIEVYEFNETEVIAEFEPINDEQYNKVYLTNLSKEQNTFDLKILGGFIQFDYIIDPAFITAEEGHDVVFAPLNSTTGMFVMAWCSDADDGSYYQILYTNGSSYGSVQTIDSAAGDSCRIGVSAFNSTAFTISHIEWISGSSDWEIFGRNIGGGNLWSIVDIDTDLNSYVDIDICALSSTNYVSNVIDDTDNDATFVIYNLGTSVKTQTDLDIGVAMDAGVLDQDAVSCTALSSNSWVFAYYDDNPDQIAYAMYDGAGTITKALAAVDASNLDGAVSTATLTNGGFVIAYCDSTDDDISFVTYDSSGNSISGIIDINGTIQDCSGAAGTHIDVAALNTTDSQFVVAYDNTLDDKVYFAIHNHSGAEILNSQFVENSDTAEKSVAVSGYDYITGNELCQYENIPVFLIAYNNVTDAVWKTYYSDGTEWDGICEFSPEANNAPNAPINVIINSTSISQLNYTTEDLRMNFYCDDNDASDVLTYHITVHNDTGQFDMNSGCNYPQYTSIILDKSNTSKYSNWSFSVNVSDDSGDYSETVSTIMNVTIRNSNASITTPAFNQTTFNNEQTINVSVKFSDDDGDANSITFEWFKNNALIRRTTNTNLANGTNTTDVLTPASFTANDQIIVQTFAFDGERNSSLKNSTQLTIASSNSAPDNPTVRINSTFASNLSAQDLHVSFTPTDPDAGETLTYDIWAFENGSRLLFNINSLPATQDALKVFAINFENTTKGQNYSAQIRVCDDSSACSAYVNTSQLVILNTGPQITNVSISPTWSVTVNGNTSAFFSFSVRDDDNYTDMDNTNIFANFSRGGETTRHNNTVLNGGCKQSGNFGKYIANYSCTINIVFYDGAGDWNVSLMLNDKSFNSTINKTVMFNLGETTSFSLSDATFSFPDTVPNAYNLTASDAIYMNNTGNDDIPAGNMNITALNIHGDSSGGTFIPARNFTISTVGGSIADSCDISLSGVYRLINKSIEGTSAFNSTIISTASLPAAVKPNNEETLFLCLRHAPTSLTGQTYSTDIEEDWSIIIR